MAMVNRPVIFQIAGFQNSGKTTLINKLIQNLSNQQISVVTIKHHGHGGKPDVIEGKDSEQHISSGALASIAEGDGRLLLHAEKEKWSLEGQINIAMHFSPEIIMIEGHKNENFPKAVILRNMEDKRLLLKLKNIKAVLYWQEEMGQLEKDFYPIPFYPIHEHEGFEWIRHYLLSQCKP